MNFSVKNLLPCNHIVRYGYDMEKDFISRLKEDYNENEEMYGVEYVKIDEKNLKILEKVRKFLNDNGYSTIDTKLDSSNCIIEIHFANTVNKEYAHSAFAVHQESEGDFENVSTLICYITNTGEGGEFGIYRNGDESSLFCKIPTNSTDNLIPCIMFDDKLWHYPQPFRNGTRFALSFHIKSRRDTIYIND